MEKESVPCPKGAEGKDAPKQLENTVYIEVEKSIDRREQTKRKTEEDCDSKAKARRFSEEEIARAPSSAARLMERFNKMRWSSSPCAGTTSRSEPKHPDDLSQVGDPEEGTNPLGASTNP